MFTRTAVCRLKVGILGATGLVGRAAVAAVANNKNGLQLGTIVGSTASNNADYEEVWMRKENDLEEHYGKGFWKGMPFPKGIGKRTVSTYEEMLSGDDDIIFSSIPLRAGGLEDGLLKAGHFVVSNSPYRRFEDDVPVVVSEVNPHVLDSSARYIKSPNCCTNGIALTLKPIIDHCGISECSITTYQSISGRGDLKYSRHLVDGNVYPIGRTEENTEEYIKKEVRKIFASEESFGISVSCQRVPVQRNHFIDMKLKLKHKITKEEAVALWESFNPLKRLNDEGVFSHNSTSPLLVMDTVGYPRPIIKDGPELGMTVHVGNILTDDECFDLRYNLVVDNIDRGAFGGPIQNAQFVLYMKQQEQLVNNSEHLTSGVTF